MNLSKIDDAEKMLINLVAKIAPWFAPFPTAYLVERATVVHLKWPDYVGFIAAAVIECLGLVTCSTALDLYQFNQTRRKMDSPAPFGLAVALILLYFSVAVLLTVVLDIQPSWSGYAPTIFPLLSLAGFTVIALRINHQNRLKQIANERAERKAERQENRQIQHQALRDLLDPAPSIDLSNSRMFDTNLDRLQAGRRAKLDSRLDTLLDAYRRNPNLRISDAARLLNVSRQSIYSYLDQLEQSGKIKRNGHGTEVLE